MGEPPEAETTESGDGRDASRAATWSVTELHDAVNGLIDHAFGSPVWVTGELRSLHRSAAGHSYFDLVEPGTDGTHNAARLSVTLFSGYRNRVNAIVTKRGGGVRIEEGTVLRISGELQTYPAQSRLQLMMTGIDPSYTLAVAQQKRDRALAALANAGLLDANALVEVPHPPLRVAIVTSRGSAAEADTLHELERSRVGLSVSRIDARTQGAEAEATIVAALRTAAELKVDVVLLVRGGGASTDLATFDGERLGRAIATLGVAVFTGIGHETDRTVADEVAHSAFKTPTAAAASVVERAESAHEQLGATTASLRSAAEGRLARAGNLLDSQTRSVAIASRGHLNRESAGLDSRLARVASAAPLSAGRLAARVDSLAARVEPAATRALESAGTRLGNLEGLVAARDPALLLKRGWSITRDATGAIVSSALGLEAGTELVTTVADGRISSVVTEGGSE
ncbi:MAG: exodeoxyribonuclease VII large subunit [Actinomycetia bacterium]|nr:exodeoxyribonuclease VII large subunit [Actinomycetes bacterium]